jgi:hypothetical protein
MKKDNPVIKQVPIEGSDLTLRYSPEALYKQGFNYFFPLVLVVMPDVDEASDITHQLTLQFIQEYEARTAIQMRTFQESIKTEAMSKTFGEAWKGVLRHRVTPETDKVIRKNLKKLYDEIFNSRRKAVWGKQRPGRLPRSEAEFWIAGAKVLDESVTIVNELKSANIRHVTQTDVARKMFGDIDNLNDQRSSYSRALKSTNLTFDDVLQAADKKVLTENCK